MDWSAYLPMILQGAGVTMTITLASIVIGAALAFFFGILRVEGGPMLSTIALCYTEVFRGTSLLVQLFWFYYALPLVGLSFEPITTGILVLAAHAGGYGAEIVRGALSSVSTQQLEAARALNFNRFQTLFRISLPQAIVEMMPAFGNLAIETLKLSSLVSLISIADLTFTAQSIRNLTLDSASIYSVTLLCYFAMSLVLMVAIRIIEHVVRRGDVFPRSAHS
ncbi:ectoine/hydroxyectoine ABC transporter permease subunit EhuC [Pseudorhizobium flavum]|jgi:polar amino acid transport system permease protein|uniref:Polar amino acid transport system permease protein n=1 Tax=Pseudorhizobium flavum TaxID=1335061 RepID=A0A7W9YXZ9_9HYPH|nr:ectoine/hydroxyectoine ABC transporter permease subunit EhuC [Pseudorhizobium flavum]MBB6180322.1 polar amino acid transport system permease protein [Pseudorhizobium flavum]CAD6620258.1 ectoine/hydroxyectoine ABC transporter permease subunit EhuC [Pseudorhizobium flavum]HEV7436163.1 ectoine/hydroxyectoine ABC transporter permease subunit EhuC [Pseudorhizobium sp.]